MAEPSASIFTLLDLYAKIIEFVQKVKDGSAEHN